MYSLLKLARFDKQKLYYYGTLLDEVYTLSLVFTKETSGSSLNLSVQCLFQIKHDPPTVKSEMAEQTGRL